MQCYTRMLRTNWISHTTNIEILQQTGVQETIVMKDLKKKAQKDVLCRPHNEAHQGIALLRTIQGRRQGKRETAMNMDR